MLQVLIEQAQTAYECRDWETYAAIALEIEAVIEFERAERQALEQRAGR